MFKKHPLTDYEFPEDYNLWRNSKIQLTDERLEICGHPVMESWEEPYMKTLAEIATKKGGRILEIGFGMGISSKYINDQDIDLHIIIEGNFDVYTNALNFAMNSSVKTIPMLGFWEKLVGCFSDGTFDGILFDTYPIKKEYLFTERFRFFKEAYRLLKPNGIFTHYLGEKDPKEEYNELASNVGFNKVSYKTCSVNPPEDCKYWNDTEILAPVIMK